VCVWCCMGARYISQRTLKYVHKEPLNMYGCEQLENLGERKREREGGRERERERERVLVLIKKKERLKRERKCKRKRD